MTPNDPQDLTLPLIPEAARRNHGPVPVAAYVPIAVALLGVALILLGGIRARDAGGERPVSTLLAPPVLAIAVAAR
jgi:hypothetical protein